MTTSTTSRRLTSRQEIFAHEVGGGLNQTEAHRIAFPDFNGSDAARASKASLIAAKPHVRARIDQIRSIGARAASVDLASHLTRLDALSRSAERAGKFDAAVKAEENRGKAAGLYSDKVELTGKDGGPIETVAKVSIYIPSNGRDG